MAFSNCIVMARMNRLCFSAIGDLLPFIPLYMKQLGLTSVEAGIIYGTIPFITFFIRPFVGILADKLHRHKLVLMVCCLLTGLFYMLLLVIPSKKMSQTIEIRTNIHCNLQDSFISDCVKTEKDGSRSSSCPLVLTDYANLTMGLRNTSKISCLANCQFALPGAYTTRVCFLPGVRPYNERKCVDIWVSSNSNSQVKFKFTNMSDIMDREVIRDQTNWEYMRCRDYDLKGVEYENIFYWQMLCDRQLTLNCILQCNHHVDNGCDVKIKEMGATFWAFIALYFLANVAFAPIMSLTDSIAYDILGKKKHHWGHQRLWGTIGFSMFAVTSTFLMEILRKENTEMNYSISFYLFGALCIMSAVASWTLQFSEELVCSKIIKTGLQLLKHAEILIFFIFVTICGIFNGAIETFLFWYLNGMENTPVIFGLSLLVNCVSETVLLVFAGKVIKKIGQIPCLYMALCAYGLRFLGYSFLTNAWYVLPIEILHGVTFGFMWAGVTSYCSIIAPPGMSATIQGLLSGIHFGLGEYNFYYHNSFLY